MCSLLMKDIEGCGVFEGSDGHKAFTCSVPLLAAEKYKVAGQLFQWSIKNGGPGLPVLSPALYDSIVEKSDVHFELADVADVSIRCVIEDVSNEDVYCQCCSYSWIALDVCCLTGLACGSDGRISYRAVCTDLPCAQLRADDLVV